MRLAKRNDRANVVVLIVRAAADGRALAYLAEQHDGTPDGIRRSANVLTGRMYDLYPDATNAGSVTVATGATGRPTWVVSPNRRHVEPIDSDAGQYVLGRLECSVTVPKDAGETVPLTGEAS